MPKRPPKIRAPLPTPMDRDLEGPVPSPPRVIVDAPRGRLLWGDCLEFLRAIPDRSARLVIADPPYAIAKEEWDEFASIDEYVSWCDAWLAEVSRVLADDGSAFVCGFSEVLAEVKARSARRFAGGCRWLIWAYRNKANLGLDWGRSHESLLHLRKSRRFALRVDAVRIPYNEHTRRYPERVQSISSQYGNGKRRDRWTPHPLGAKPRDVLEIPVLCNGMSEKTAHPTQKPEELIRTLIASSSDPEDLILDPFAGSATTLVVADRLARKWLGCDSDPRYLALARDRINQGSLSRSKTIGQSAAYDPD